jgi:hypothetical protein
MAKRRTPETVEDALDQAIGFLGKDRIAGIIGKSVNVVSKLSDPDKEHHVQMRWAVEIDRQLALNGLPQPFAEMMAARAARNLQAEQQLAHALVERRPMHEAALAVCQASELVRGIEKAEADQVYTADEIDALRKSIRALQRQLPELERAIVDRSAKAGRGRR